MPIGFDEIQLEKSSVGNIVTLKFRGKVSKADYEEFIPQLDYLMEKDNKLRLLIELHEFEGWTAGAMWEDTKFAARHFNDIERLAVVGDKHWENSMVTFLKPFTMAAAKYFDLQDIDRARQWIREKE